MHQGRASDHPHGCNRLSSVVLLLALPPPIAAHRQHVGVGEGAICTRQPRSRKVALDEQRLLQSAPAVPSCRRGIPKPYWWDSTACRSESTPAAGVAGAEAEQVRHTAVEVCDDPVHAAERLSCRLAGPIPSRRG